MKNKVVRSDDSSGGGEVVGFLIYLEVEPIGSPYGKDGKCERKG